MTIQGNDEGPKYTSYIDTARNVYFQTKQTVSESYENLKNSRLASEFSRILPKKDTEKTAEQTLNQAWPTRLGNNALSLCGAFFRSQQSKVTRAHQHMSHAGHGEKNEKTADHQQKTANFAPSIQLEKAIIKQNAAELNADKLFNDLTSGTLCSELVKKHGILEMNDKLEELNDILESKIGVGSITGDEVLKLRQQFKDIREIAVNAQAMHEDHFPLDYINDTAVFRLYICEGNNPLSNLFPKQLTLTDHKTGIMVDENNKPFGGMRDFGGLTEQIFELCNKHGGDSRILEDWLMNQSGVSSSSIPNMIKYELFLLRGKVGRENYWQGTVNPDAEGTKGDVPLETKLNEITGKQIIGLNQAIIATRTLANQGSPYYNKDENQLRATIRTSLAAWTAYNLEFYRHTQLEGVNRETQTQLLIRTESPKGIKANGIPIQKTLEGNFKLNLKKQFKMKRSIYESASREAPVFAAGTTGRIITVQEVPLHRCIYTYQLHKLKSDDEMEVGFITDDIKFKFLPDKQAPSLFKQLKQKLLPSALG